MENIYQPNDGPRGLYVHLDIESNWDGEWHTILQTADRAKVERLKAALEAEGIHVTVSCGCGSYPDGECELCNGELEQAGDNTERIKDKL